MKCSEGYDLDRKMSFTKTEYPVSEIKQKVGNTPRGRSKMVRSFSFMEMGLVGRCAAGGDGMDTAAAAEGNMKAAGEGASKKATEWRAGGG